MRPRIPPRIWLFLILLAAFAFRIFRLGVASLWYDETVSLFLARQDLVDLTRHTAGDIHPPLYYYLLHFWGRVAGWSEFSAAFVSLFFGVLLVALTYRVASEWLTPIPPAPPLLRGDKRGIALIAGFLVAISPYNLWYSQEVRMYTLGATLGLASVFFFVRVLTSHRSQVTRNFVAYVVVSALGLYTLYYFAFLLIFENIAALIWIIRKSATLAVQTVRNRQSATLAPQSKAPPWGARPKVSCRSAGVRIWFLSQLFILFLFLPWLPIAFRQATDPPVPPWRSFIPLPNVLIESFSALVLGQSVESREVWFVLIVVAAAVVVGLKSQVASRKRQTDADALNLRPVIWNLGLVLLAYTFVPLLVIYFLSLWKPLYHVRYVFTYSPAFYILLALGINRITIYELRFTNYQLRFTHYVSRFTLVLLILTSAYSARNFWFDPRYAHDDLRGAVQRIAEKWRPGDAVLVNAGYAYTAFDYYFDQPIAWRGRLTEYPPSNVSLGATQRIVDLRAGPIVLQTGSINGAPSLGWGSRESDFYATTADETRAALDRVFALHLRVWMLRLYDTVVDPDGIVRDYFAQRGRIIDDQVFTGESNARVQGYLTTREPLKQLPASATRREIILGGKIMLLGFEPAEIITRAGEVVDMNLYWRAIEATNVDENVFVGLFSTSGELVASATDVPLGNALGTTRWSAEEIMREPIRLVIPKNVARGDYALRVAMFDPFTKEPLAAEKGDWVVDANQIVATKVIVQ